MAGHGMEGVAWSGMAAWSAEGRRARLAGEAWRGLLWRGVARSGWTRPGGRGKARHGGSRRASCRRVERGAARRGQVWADGPGVVCVGSSARSGRSWRARRDRVRLAGRLVAGWTGAVQRRHGKVRAWQGLARLDEVWPGREDGCGEAGSGGARVGGAGSGSARLGEDGLGRAGAGVGRGRGPSLNAAHLGRKETLTWNRDHSIRNDSSRRESRIGSSRPRRHTRAPGRFDRKHFKAVVPKDRTKAKAARRLTLLAAVLGIALLWPRRRAVVGQYSRDRVRQIRASPENVRRNQRSRPSPSPRRRGTSAWAAWRRSTGSGCIVLLIAARLGCGEPLPWVDVAVWDRATAFSLTSASGRVCFRRPAA